ncbi:MAG: hypothetical protein JKY92_03420, partial [Magnetovibrio sp.]|nr:hypothetical protein [Magnetovibrio sp.]
MQRTNTPFFVSLKLSLMVLGLVLGAPVHGYAQTTQPIPRTTTEILVEVVKPIDPFEPAVIIHFREEMRNFVTNLSSFAHRVNPNFIMIAQDGLALVNKIDLNDETQRYPANAYMRSLDGILETNLLDEKVMAPNGKPDPALVAQLEYRNNNLKTVASMRIPVFNMEYSTEAGYVDKIYADSAQKGFIPFVAEAPNLSSIPKFPSSIYKANPVNVMSIADVKNYLYLNNSQAFGQVYEYILKLRETNYDALIVDIFHGQKPMSKANVKLLKYKRLGSRRLVLAEIDISSASVFQYFWKSGWRAGNPPFIYAPYKADPDR